MNGEARNNATLARYGSEGPVNWFNTKWSCHICGKYIDRQKTREGHYIHQHAGAPTIEQYPEWSFTKWACHVCGVHCPDRQGRNNHYARFHPNNRPKYLCAAPPNQISPRHFLPVAQAPLQLPGRVIEGLENIVLEGREESEGDEQNAEGDDDEPKVIENKMDDNTSGEKKPVREQDVDELDEEEYDVMDIALPILAPAGPSTQKPAQAVIERLGLKRKRSDEAGPSSKMRPSTQSGSVEGEEVQGEQVQHDRGQSVQQTQPIASTSGSRAMQVDEGIQDSANPTPQTPRIADLTTSAEVGSSEAITNPKPHPTSTSTHMQTFSKLLDQRERDLDKRLHRLQAKETAFEGKKQLLDGEREKHREERRKWLQKKYEEEEELERRRGEVERMEGELLSKRLE